MLYAGLLLGRSGRSVHRVLWSLLWAPWLAACALVLELAGDLLAAHAFGISGLFQEREAGDPVLAVWLGLLSAYAAGILLGWAVALLVARRRIRSGRWETIRPVEGDR